MEKICLTVGGEAKEITSFNTKTYFALSDLTDKESTAETKAEIVAVAFGLDKKDVLEQTEPVEFVVTYQKITRAVLQILRETAEALEVIQGNAPTPPDSD